MTQTELMSKREKAIENFLEVKKHVRHLLADSDLTDVQRYVLGSIETQLDWLLENETERKQ